MKKIPLYLSLVAVSTALFAAEMNEEQLVSSFLTRKETPDQKIDETPKPIKKGFFYLKGGLTPDLLTNGPAAFFGLGYRSELFSTIHGAIDVNLFQYSVKEFIDSTSGAVFFPSLSYQYYFSPKEKQSFFAGIGGAFTSQFPILRTLENPEVAYEVWREEVEKDYEKAFMGTAAVISFGYNPNLRSRFLNSFQLDVFYPVTNFNEKATEDLSDPLVAITYSIGY